MEKTFIEIVEISKKQAVSKFKEGEMYWQVDITDGKTGRKARVFGDWGKDWKLGDVIEATWEKGEPWTDKQGTQHDQWKLKDPNAAPKKTWSGGRGGGESTPSIVHAWMVAATLAPFFYPKGGKKLADIEDLANAILPKLQPAKVAEPAAAAPAAQAAAPAKPVAPAAPAAPAVAVDTTPKGADDDFEEDDDKPF